MFIAFLGESILQREEEKLRKEFNDKSDFAVADQATLKIKWKCKKKSGDGCSTGYSKHSLLKILQKYGPVSDVIVNPRRIGSALAIFNSIAAAKICMQREKGDESCPLSFRMLHNTDNHDSKSAKIPETTFTENASFSSFPSNAFSQNVMNPPASINLVPPVDRDYESLTLMRLILSCQITPNTYSQIPNTPIILSELIFEFQLLLIKHDFKIMWPTFFGWV